MKYIKIIACFFWAFHLTTGFSQSTGRFQFFGRTLVVSPQVHEDKTVTFRIAAPEARTVSLAISGMKRLDMQKEADGIWSVTTEKLAPDLYPYQFVVDGLFIPDPANPAVSSGYKIKVGQSLLEVHGTPAEPWEIRDVAHGKVTQHFYQSKLIGDHRDYYVYTPPGYDSQRKAAYPVLYLLHGLTEDASAWLVSGRANFIIDNLMAEGKIVPIVLVFPLGYGDPNDIVKGVGGPFEKFTQSLFDEVIPQVETQYHVSNQASQRAIAGLSMGAGQALFIGLNNPDKFTYIGGFSSAVVMYGMNRDRSTVQQPELLLDAKLFETVFPKLDSGINKKLKRLWIATGDGDGEFNFSLEFKYWLKSKHIQFDEIITPGQHTWMVWKRNLVDFSQLLFK